MNKENFKPIFNKLSILSKLELDDINKKIEYILNNKVTNESIIESTLDRLLSLEFVNYIDIEKPYFILFDYYQNINKESAIEYKKYFIDKYQEIIKIKKLNK